MTTTGKTISWVVVALIIVAIIIGFSRTPKVDEGVISKEPIKIGVMAPLTGDAAIYGEPAINVYKIAVEEINTSGGIDGRNLEFIIEDSKCNGKDGASAASKLVNVDKVQVIIGGICSGETLAAVPVVETGKVALFSPGASSPDLTNKGPFFSRDYPSDASQGSVLAEAALKLGFKKVAFVQEQTDYAVGITKAFSSVFEKGGGTIVKEEFPTDTSDFRTTLTKLQSQKPDMLFINTQTAPVTDRILKQTTALNWKVKIFLNDVSIDAPQLMTDHSKILEGTVGAVFKVDPSNTKFAKVLADYKVKYGVDMPYQSYGQTEYDAIYLIKEAISDVGYDGVKIAQWLKNVKNWEGASGSVTIGSDGDRIGGHSLQIVKNGKTEPYSP